MFVDVQDLLKTALTAARQAGAYLLEQYGKLDPTDIDEKVANDYVTVVDRTSEQIIIDHIRQAHPAHTIVAEESGHARAGNAYEWIIDPLDGTSNFIHNIPVFAVSIAVRKGREVLAGVVFNPVLNECFSAARGAGAYLNDAPIRVSPQQDFSRAFLATGFPHQRKRQLPRFIAAANDIFFASGGIRRLGSAALDLCYTACGRFEGYWELGLHPWDCAAGSLIVIEAGGVVSDFWGGDTYIDSGFLICGNAAVHNRLQFHLCNHFTERLA